MFKIGDKVDVIHHVTKKVLIPGKVVLSVIYGAEACRVTDIGTVEWKNLALVEGQHMPKKKSSSAKKPKTYVFVYGTLKKGFKNHQFLLDLGAEFVGKGNTANTFKLLDLGLYPAATYSATHAGGRRLPVEIYRVDEEVIPQLDNFEGNFYQRDYINVYDDDSTYAGVIYLLDKPPHSRPLPTIKEWTKKLDCA